MGYLSNRLSPNSVWAQALRRPPSGPERRMAGDDTRQSALGASMNAKNDPLRDFYSVLLNERGADGERPLGPSALEQMQTLNEMTPYDPDSTDMMAGLPDALEYMMDSSLMPGPGVMAGTVGRAGSVADALSGVADDAARVADDVPGITAYHGSPHTFDQFRWDDTTRGTGEGAQAYGDGLYFADAEDVARGYRDTLSGETLLRSDGTVWSPNDMQHLNVNAAARRNGTDLGATIERAEGLLKKANDQTRPPNHRHRRSVGLAHQQLLESDLAVLRQLQSEGGVSSNPGSMYQARLNANPEDLLDWDKPLSGQTQSVQDRINEIVRTTQGERDSLQIRSLLELMGGGSAASDKLRNAGIPGIRYLDGNSRGLGEGTSNYTVWDDSIIEILKRYGLIPPVAAGSAMLLNGNEAEASQ